MCSLLAVGCAGSSPLNPAARPLAEIEVSSALNIRPRMNLDYRDIRSVRSQIIGRGSAGMQRWQCSLWTATELRNNCPVTQARIACVDAWPVGIGKVSDPQLNCPARLMHIGRERVGLLPSHRLAEWSGCDWRCECEPRVPIGMATEPGCCQSGACANTHCLFRPDARSAQPGSSR